VNRSGSAAIVTVALMDARSSPAGRRRRTRLHHPIYMPAVGQAARPHSSRHPYAGAPIGIPPAGQPVPVNMAYFGGHVQVTPDIYLVFWAGARQARSSTRLLAKPRERSRRRPAQRMQDFTAAIGGTA